MRNLKKILALVLALMMTVSLMVVASAASIDDFDDSEKINDTYAEAVEVLAGIGIYQGDTEGTFRPQENLSRAEVATLLYRLLSGDVNGDKVNTYAGHDEFSDVTPEAWYAGYINYAYINGWVIGNGDGTYGPDDNVTGEELATMLVRALGRDANGEEISGDDWALEASVLAAKLGLIDNLGGLFLLSDDITREQTAQMIFNALNAETWKYNGLIYKQNTTTLGEEKLDLAYAPTGYYDVWGRPAEIWYADANDNNSFDIDVEKLYVAIEIEALYTDNEPITECELSTELGLNKRVTGIDVFINGVKTDNDEAITPTNLTATMDSKQGRQMEVYDADSNGTVDTIVYIDTYLAQVAAVHEATSDPAGHPDTDAYSNLTVYYATVKGGTKSWTMDSIDYAKGSYILVNVNEGDEYFYQLNDEAAYVVYPVQEAEAFNGVQTKVWSNDSQHTIDDVTYDDAFKYVKDDATDDKLESYTWFLDQFGNVIGSAKIDRTGYAVLKDLIWIVGKPGYAEATLVYMDGSEATVEVAAFDGLDADGDNWNSTSGPEEPELQDANTNTHFVEFPGVSTDTKYNAIYNGYALYQTYTNDDGTVELLDNTVNVADEVMIDTDKLRIVVPGASNDILVDDDTQFLVKNADNTYDSYTLADVPSFADNALIFYTMNGKFADQVYVKSGGGEGRAGSLSVRDHR